MRAINETDLNDKEEAPFGYHFLWYFLQLIFSAPGVMIASIPVLLVLSALGLTADHQPGKFAGYETLVDLYVGILVGWWMSHRAPLLVGSGRWIWVLPAAVILGDLASGPDGLSGYLFESKAEGIGVLIMLGACSMIGYSIGMALWRLNQRWAKSGSSSVRQRLVTISSVAVIVLCVLALVLQSYEIRIWSLEK